MLFLTDYFTKWVEAKALHQVKDTEVKNLSGKISSADLVSRTKSSQTTVHNSSVSYSKNFVSSGTSSLPSPLRDILSRMDKPNLPIKPLSIHSGSGSKTQKEDEPMSYLVFYDRTKLPQKLRLGLCHSLWHTDPKPSCRSK